MRLYISSIFTTIMLFCSACAGTNLHTSAPHNKKKSYEDILNSVVALVEPNSNGLQTPTCTAFFISETDLVTAGHCVLDRKLLINFTPNGSKVTIEWEKTEDVLDKTIHFVTKKQYEKWFTIPVAKRPKKPEYSSASVISIISPVDLNDKFDNDIALLRITNSSFKSKKSLHVRNWIKNPPKVGEDAYAIGLPSGEPWVLTRGIISKINISKNYLVQVWHDARIGHGSSGGPLLDQKGNVVGINVKISRENIFSKATPSSVISTLYKLYKTRKEIENIK